MQSLVEMEEYYLYHHRAVGSSFKTVIHYQNTFIVFHRFLMSTGKPADSSILLSATFKAFSVDCTPHRGPR